MTKQTNKDQFNKQTGKIRSRAFPPADKTAKVLSALCPQSELSQTLEQSEPLGCRLGYISHLSLHYQVHSTRARGLMCVQFVLAFYDLILFYLAPDFPVGLHGLAFLKLILLIMVEVKKAFI